MSETIKIEVVNNNEGDRFFPGYKGKYSKLETVSANTLQDKPLLVDIKDSDYDEIKSSLLRGGVFVKKHSKGIFSKSKGSNTLSDEQKELEKKYKALLKKLPKEGKEKYKSLSIEEITEETLTEMETLIEG